MDLYSALFLLCFLKVVSTGSRLQRAIVCDPLTDNTANLTQSNTEDAGGKQKSRCPNLRGSDSTDALGERSEGSIIIYRLASSSSMPPLPCLKKARSESADHQLELPQEKRCRVGELVCCPSIPPAVLWFVRTHFHAQAFHLPDRQCEAAAAT